MVTVIPIVIGALGTIPKGLIKGLEALEIGERTEAIQTTTLLRSEYPEEDWSLEESYHIYQPLRSGRIWLKVIFLSGV